MSPNGLEKYMCFNIINKLASNDNFQFSSSLLDSSVWVKKLGKDSEVKRILFLLVYEYFWKVSRKIDKKIKLL